MVKSAGELETHISDVRNVTHFIGGHIPSRIAFAPKRLFLSAVYLNRTFGYMDSAEPSPSGGGGRGWGAVCYLLKHIATMRYSPIDRTLSMTDRRPTDYGGNPHPSKTGKREMRRSNCNTTGVLASETHFGSTRHFERGAEFGEAVRDLANPHCPETPGARGRL